MDVHRADTSAKTDVWVVSIKGGAPKVHALRFSATKRSYRAVVVAYHAYIRSSQCDSSTEGLRY